MGPPVTFELKVKGQNQLGFWNNSIRPASGASFSKIGRPTFSTSGIIPHSMTLKCYCFITSSLLDVKVRASCKVCTIFEVFDV